LPRKPALERCHALVDVPGGGDKLFAAGGEHIARGQALEQPQPKLLLERVDAPQHGRMIDAQAARGPRQRAMVRNGENVAKVIPLQLDHADGALLRALRAARSTGNSIVQYGGFCASWGNAAFTLVDHQGTVKM
jgi:hypothetical protein